MSMMRKVLMFVAVIVLSIDWYLMLTGGYSVTGYVLDSTFGAGSVDTMARNIHAGWSS